MNASGHNIKFCYLYRDSGNYKEFGYEIFSNINNIPIQKIEKIIKSNLIDREFFDPVEWGVKQLYKCSFDFELDHSWHEFEVLETTSENPTVNIDIERFLNSICQ